MRISFVPSGSVGAVDRMAQRSLSVACRTPKLVSLSFSLLLLAVACCLWPASSCAQSTNAAVGGQITDQAGRSVPGATVVFTNLNTNVPFTTQTNNQGIYSLPNLPPGIYRENVTKDGFKSIVKGDIELHVQDVASINFQMQVGSVTESVTVEGGAPLIDTESTAVSTMVDQTYVKNMPLNGRSFQDLILLTPGVVTTSPQTNAALGGSGEFSVNGQRTESNYYTVDGVSVNIGIQAGNVRLPSTSGSLPAATALGTTQGLVSVEALQEFRVSSSTYSAEYGRNPGGQFSFATRSGTNQWHGSAFDYIRNDVFDANDWFNNFLGVPTSPLRQNDFGATFGGPVTLPHIYHGENKTFFFFSYEGLRLTQPQAATISYVPDTALRQSAPAALQPILNAFPVQNGAEIGDGSAEFLSAWSNSSSLDSYSTRLDHQVNQKSRLFFRFASTSSGSFLRTGGSQFSVPSNPSTDSLTAHTYTLGVTSAFSAHFGNEFRLNYSSNIDSFHARLDNFGGATPVDLFLLQGFRSLTNPSPLVEFNLGFTFFTSINQQQTTGKQQQWNVVDTASFLIGSHSMKVGFDFRRLSPIQFQPSPSVIYEYDSAASVQANSDDFGQASTFAGAKPTYINFSAFGQDEWRISPRLALSIGLRWEVNPAPGAADGNLPYTTLGTNVATLALAPKGTPLWRTTWYNFAPRLGVAYVLLDKPGYQTVLRSGGGVFYDTGQQTGSYGFLGPGFSAQTMFFGVPFPQPPSQVSPPITNPPTPPFGPVWAFPAHLQLPFTIQWNASVEQSLGQAQSLAVSYVGANGRRLIGLTEVNATAFNPSFTSVNFFQNGLTSDYSALQVKFQRRLARGLEALASYTWSHSIDFGSQDAAEPFQRGNSIFDVRHTFSGAFSYDLPNLSGNPFARALLHWGLDSRFSARTAFPVPLNGRLRVDPATGLLTHHGLNIVPNKPFYIFGPQFPGGRSINAAAFSTPPGNTVGDSPRDFLRGFGAWQMDMAVRREFPIRDQFKLQFRAEAFNLFNHPSFGFINSTLCAPGPGCTFGQATATLAQSLGVLSPLYQAGGPRSMQFALKLMF